MFSRGGGAAVSEAGPRPHHDRKGSRPWARAAAHRRTQQLIAALRATAAISATEDANERTDLADRLCMTAVQALGARGATLCAQFAPGMSVPVGVSDPTSARVEELQFSAGDGPCWEAHATGKVVVADLRLEDSLRRWPAYTLSVRRESDYGAVVALPLTLASGLGLVFTVYDSSLSSAMWWLSAVEVTGALREVLDTASAPVARGGSVWLDSSSTLRRGAVWVAESVLVEADPSLDPARALEALRTFGAVEGLTVDAAAAALVQGRLSTSQVLGRATPPD